MDSSAQGRSRATYIGGPTVLIEFAGLRFLTDPTLDPGGTEYPTAAYTLQKTQPPALTDPGPIDAVLLSHDHHFDNLDHAGRAFLAVAGTTFTTRAGAERLGGHARGMAPWDQAELPVPGGGVVRITATPARHGPAGGDRGPVIGFLLELVGGGLPAIYFSGDTVWYEEIMRIGERAHIGSAFLNLGAAKVAVAGPAPLTFTAAEGILLAQAWPDVTIVPLHFEGWAHFSEGAAEVRAAFAGAGLSDRLRWLPPGRPVELSFDR